MWLPSHPLLAKTNGEYNESHMGEYNAEIERS